MSYEPTRWRNGETPINEDNLMKIENELEKLDSASDSQSEKMTEMQGNITLLIAEINKNRIYKGTLKDNTDLNDLTEEGFSVYYTGGRTLKNAGTNYNYAYLIVISNGALIHQYFIKPATPTFMIREKSGDPATWSLWKKVQSFS